MQKDTLIYDLFKAYYDARKNKRNTSDQLKFELNLEQNLIELYEDLKNNNYEISPCIYFINTYPIKREIFAWNFRDRVVHHLIYNYVYDILDKHFIYDSYSCRIWKWTSLGIKRVDKFIRSCSQNYTKDCYVLKLDISGYFMNIDKTKLYEKIEKILKKNEQNIKIDLSFLLEIIRKVVFNNPIEKAIFKWKREDYIGLPKNKSLFFARSGCGLPIWNLTSQLFSNVYLDDFDKFIKYELAYKYYGRYVDDFFIIDENKESLVLLIKKIKNYLKDNLWLILHPDKIYLQHYSKWVLFLWNIIKPHRVYVRKRTLWNFYKTVYNINKKFKNDEIINKNDYHNHVLSPINSYLWFIKKTSSFKVKIKILKKLDKWLLNFLYLDYKFNKIIFKNDKLPKFTCL